MSDLPAGEWSALLVGHQWPGSAALAALLSAADRRGVQARAYEDYGTTLRGVRTQTLASQEGLTAEDLRRAFLDGETGAHGIAERSLAKQRAYRSAQQWAVSLRTDLTDIAQTGNATIRSILDSPTPAPEKVAAIVDTVTAAQRSANSRAAMYSANLLGEIQTVLDCSGSDVGARQFAQSAGVDLSRAFSTTDAAAVTTEVSRLVEAHSAPVGDSAPAPAPVPGTPAPESDSAGTSMQRIGGAAAEALSLAAAGALGIPVAASDAARPATEEPQIPIASGTSIPTETNPTATNPTATNPTAPNPAAPNPAAPNPAAPGSVPLQTGAPGAGTARPVPAGGIAPPGRPPGPLTGYGADLRPTVTAGAPPTRAAVAGSAPLSTTGAGAPGPAPVPISRAPRPAPVAGERARDTPAAGRLDGLLAAVVRQRPELRWAVGDLGDGSAVLVTDLAGGWIPAGVDIPAGLRLSAPRAGGGSLTELLGPAAPSLAYRPGDPVTGTAGADPALAPQARRAPEVQDLRWQLCRATQWRDGLPRIAHTLARAASTGTGWLDSEVSLLGRHLYELAGAVLADYPYAVDPRALGNWQLLSSLRALLDGDEIAGNYHFAWFLAQNPEAHR